MEAFYKLAYDIGCYYAFAAFFLSYLAGYEVNPFSFLVFFAACFMAVHAEKSKRLEPVCRIGAFLLPVIPLLMEGNIWGKLVLILPWIYLVVTVVREGYDISYKRFKKTYLAFFWIFLAVFSFFVGEDRVKGEVAMIVTVPFLLILLVSGIFLLQMLRFQPGSGDKKKLEKYQRRQLVVFMAAATVLTVGNVVELLYVYVFFPLSKLALEAVFGLAVFIVSKLDSPPKPPKKIGDTGGDVREFAEKIQEIRDNTETIWGKIPERVMAEPSKEMDWIPIIIGAVVLGAIVILVVLIGGKKKNRKQAIIEDEREDCYDDVTLKKTVKKHSVHPEIAIRYYYREFMKKSEAKKHKLAASDTTNEILVKYRAWNSVTTEQMTEAEEATALYQKTRYSKARMTHTDAKRMKALVKGL